MITVEDFVNLCIETNCLEVEIYSDGEGDVVWSGNANDIPDEYAGEVVNSFDAPSKRYTLTLNID